VQTQKKIKQTDAIFAKLKVVNTAADEAETVLRLSWDAKATVKIGEFVRGGNNRLERKGADHDFKPDGILNPFGILLPKWDDLQLFFTASPVTSDFIVDVLERWWRKKRKRFPQVDTLVINQDNGPEIHSRRTQFLKRMVQFAGAYGLLIRLAYYTIAVRQPTSVANGSVLGGAGGGGTDRSFARTMAAQRIFGSCYKVSCRGGFQAQLL
jgi:hypothetical protein